MKERRRPLKVGDTVRMELARLLREELRDPGIGFATITQVEMSADLRSARVYVSVLGSADAFKKSVAALNHAAGKLRGMVGRNCGLRYAPELHFAEDHSMERGARIEELLRGIPKPAPEAPPDDGEGQDGNEDVDKGEK